MQHYIGIPRSSLTQHFPPSSQLLAGGNRAIKHLREVEKERDQKVRVCAKGRIYDISTLAVDTDKPNIMETPRLRTHFVLVTFALLVAVRRRRRGHG